MKKTVSSLKKQIANHRM